MGGIIAIPTGTVTFLFTDIEGSTKLAQKYPDRWESLRERHHAILQFAMDSYNGYVFQIIGDAFCVAFHTARDGLNAALEAQRELQSEDWGNTPIKVRMGLHTGSAELHGTDYRGYLTMAKVQRVMSVAYGGQVLLSNASVELVRGELPQHVSLVNIGEHRLKGVLNPEHLWQVNAPDLPQDFPPLQSLNSIPNNLPTQLTSFVGREKEIPEVKEELNKHRLVTLTGSGGTGKTRLSLQVAAEVLESFKHGVWFVELAPLTDPELIPQSILSTIGLSEQAGKTPVEVLKEYLHEKTSLIVLDNCEHLIEASAKVANILLNAAPELKILASSREALGVHGEASYPVPSLFLPDPKHLPNIEQLSQYEAVRLFIDRALLVQPHFVVTNENAPAVAQICHRLDGIPLAIELAAARLRILSAEQISSRLDDRFRLLTGGARTAVPRQQTLRAMIDWSYDLLTERERTLLRRLAVFSGGWTLEAAEQVCADSDHSSILEEEVLDLLSHLVDKSLVHAKDIGNGTRYSMLETTRQYAREKLESIGETAQLCRKHANYFANLQLNTDDDIDNIRSVFYWCLATGEAGPVLELSRNFFFWEKRVREGLHFISQVLAMKDAQGPTWERGHVIYSAAVLSFFHRDFPTGRAYVNELLKLSHEIHDDRLIWQTKIVDGGLTLAEGNYERAYRLFLDGKRDKEGSRDEEDKFEYAMCTIGLAACALMLQNLDEAKQYAEEAHHIFSEVGRNKYLVDGDMVLGHVALETDNLEKARQYFRQGIKDAAANSVQQKLGVIFAGLGGVALKEGKFHEAAKWFGIADMMVTTTGYHARFLPDAISQRHLAHLKSILDPDVFQAAWKEGNTMTLDQAIAFALEENNE